MKKILRSYKPQKRLVLVLLLIVFLACAAIFFILHSIVRYRYADHLIKAEELKSLDDFAPECILILGAGVTDGGKPMPMLLERLKTGLSLYNSKAAGKIVVSGDHGRDGYDEVNVMKGWLVDNGVPSEDIFMDHAGFSTYESMVRMKKVFGVSKMIVVTQKYHQYRALYLANTLGIKSYGVACDEMIYSGQSYREIREIAARVKDWFYCAFKAKTKYLGDSISLKGSGDVTNDR